MPGYFNLYWDAQQGRLWLEIDMWRTEFLYQTSLRSGIGSNDIGFDRGQLGGTRVVYFDRSGPKVLLIESNLDYRAITENSDERRTVQESFAESALWGFTIAAEENGHVLVDATDFFLRDAHGIPQRLSDEKQGSFRLDSSRCAIYLPQTKNFPLNTEVEATLTFASENPGAWVREVTPSPDSLTVREHHSLVRLPEPGYKSRAYDPRSSFIGISFKDYATPVGEPLVKRYAIRHRLAKKDPTASISDPVEPIVYYLDPGTPEPIRSAILEGANWWNQAFEAAGYRNAFRVEMLPDGADLLDLRYNVIQWVIAPPAAGRTVIPSSTRATAKSLRGTLHSALCAFGRTTSSQRASWLPMKKESPFPRKCYGFPLPVCANWPRTRSVTRSVSCTITLPAP